MFPECNRDTNAHHYYCRIDYCNALLSNSFSKTQQHQKEKTHYTNFKVSALTICLLQNPSEDPFSLHVNILTTNYNTIVACINTLDAIRCTAKTC